MTDALKEAVRLNSLISYDEELLSCDRERLILVKDNICTVDYDTTCASRVLEGYRPAYDATAVAKLRNSGFRILGKTNMDEFAMGSTGETSVFGPILNPCDDTHVAGGSSGGSAVAVKVGLVDYALGSDTGGSIRLPASYCGVVGIKPTYGRVSRYGLISYASSFDQIGVLAKDSLSAAYILDVICGVDKRDATSVERRMDESFVSLCDGSIEGLRIGFPTRLKVDDGVRDSIDKALNLLRECGAVIVDIDLELLHEALAAYYIIACAQASSNLARYDGIKYGKGLEYMGEEVVKRMKLGEYVLSAGFYDEYYMKALKLRRVISEQYNKIYGDVDIIAGPVAPGIAPKLHEYKNGLNMYMCDIYNISANLLGLPALSVPIFPSDGMPVGLSLMGKHWCEGDILRVAHKIEGSVNIR